MNNYSIIYENNNLRVINRSKGKELSKNEVFVLLHDIDNNDHTKVFSGGEKLIIKCARIGVNAVLENPKEIMKSKYRYLLSKTMGRLNEGVKQIQAEKHKHKPTVVQKALKITSAVAPVVLIATLATSKSEVKSVNNEIFKEPIPLEDLQEKVINNSDQEIIDTVNRRVNIVKPIELASSPKQGNNEILAGSKTVQYYDSGSKTNAYNRVYEVELPIADLSKTDETIEVQKYSEVIEAAANRWGESPNWLSGLMTTESRGNETNLMQIIHSAFDGQVMKVYNFEEDTWKKVVFTNTPEKYKDVDITISEKELNNPKTNISAAAIILNYYIHYLNTDNISIITEAYNKGKGNLDTNINAYCNYSGLTYDQVLSDPTNTAFLDFSDACGQGGPEYTETVYKFAPDTEDGIYFYRMKDDKKEKVTLRVNRVLEQEVAKAR